MWGRGAESDHYRRIVVQTLEAEIPLVLDRTNGRPLGRLVLDSDATWPASMAKLAPRRLLCHLAPSRYVALIAIDAPNP